MQVVPRNHSIPNFSLAGGKARTTFSFTSLLADFVLVNVAFFSVLVIKHDALAASGQRLRLLGSFYTVWLLTSLLTNKFNLRNYGNYFRGLLTFVKSNVLLLYLNLCLTFVFGLHGYFRLHMFEVLILLFLLETVLFTEYYFRFAKDILTLINRQALRNATSRFSILLFSADFFLFTVSFWVINYMMTGSMHLNIECQKTLLVLYGFWLATSLLTRKFEHQRYRKLRHLLSPHIKAVILFGVSFYGIFLLTGFPNMMPDHVLGTLSLSLVLGVVPNSVYTMVRLGYKWRGEDVESAEEVKFLLQQEELAIAPGQSKLEEVGVEDSLRDGFLSSFPELFKLIKQTIRLSEISLRRMEVFFTNTDLSKVGICDNSVKLLINLDRLNDVRSTNRYLLEVHKKLANGGVFVCNGDTIDIHRRRFMLRYPNYVWQTLYALDFFYTRFLSHIPGLRLIYLVLSRGKNRVISRAEFLGRLYFCGFKVLAAEIIGGHYHVIAQKVKTPSEDTNPSKDIVIKMKRIGYRGEVILLNKFRTMFPYSEYLQEYIYERNKLQSNGKFKSDFRITEWGKVFRKFWIDEMPQFINYFRGELNIVGVRALSKQYFDLYPKDLQELRIKFKPGLIPPYYFDLPKSFDEILDSERRYLQQKLTRPLWTDVKYLTVAFYNIFLRGVRSK